MYSIFNYNYPNAYNKCYSKNAFHEDGSWKKIFFSFLNKNCLFKYQILKTKNKNLILFSSKKIAIF